MLNASEACIAPPEKMRARRDLKQKNNRDFLGKDSIVSKAYEIFHVGLAPRMYVLLPSFLHNTNGQHRLLF